MGKPLFAEYWSVLFSPAQAGSITGTVEGLSPPCLDKDRLTQMIIASGG